MSGIYGRTKRTNALMNKYHILFKDYVDEFFSKGVDYLANTPEEALAKWREENPKAIFLACYCRNI